MVSDKKIESVIFHWSESLSITKIIDPTFKKIYDADYRTEPGEAIKLIEAAQRELNQLCKFCFPTCITVVLKNNRQFKLTVDITEKMRPLTDYI